MATRPEGLYPSLEVNWVAMSSSEDLALSIIEDNGRLLYFLTGGVFLAYSSSWVKQAGRFVAIIPSLLFEYCLVKSEEELMEEMKLPRRRVDLRPMLIMAFCACAVIYPAPASRAFFMT